MKTLTTLLIMLLLCSTVNAQRFFPVKTHHITKKQIMFLAIDAGVRGLDAYSTRRMLASGRSHEKFLPDFISHNTPVMFIYSESVVYSEYRFMHRFPNSKVFKVLPLIDAIQDVPWAIHNMTLPTKKQDQNFNLPHPPVR